MRFFVTQNYLMPSQNRIMRCSFLQYMQCVCKMVQKGRIWNKLWEEMGEDRM